MTFCTKLYHLYHNLRMSERAKRAVFGQKNEGAAAVTVCRNRVKLRPARLLNGGRCASIRSAVGVSPSGKAADFESAIPRFESWHPSLHAGAFT